MCVPPSVSAEAGSSQSANSMDEFWNNLEENFLTDKAAPPPPKEAGSREDNFWENVNYDDYRDEPKGANIAPSKEGGRADKFIENLDWSRYEKSSSSTQKKESDEDSSMNGSPALIVIAFIIALVAIETERKNQIKIDYRIVFLCAALAVLLFPPWIYVIEASAYTRIYPAGYYFIAFSPPLKSPSLSSIAGASIDITKLLVQLAIIAACFTAVHIGRKAKEKV